MRNQARCQRTTVSGRTMARASGQRLQDRRSRIQKTRSARGCRGASARPGWRAAGGGPGSRSPDGVESAWPRGASAGGLRRGGASRRGESRPWEESSMVPGRTGFWRGTGVDHLRQLPTSTSTAGNTARPSGIDPRPTPGPEGLGDVKEPDSRNNSPGCWRGRGGLEPRARSGSLPRSSGGCPLGAAVGRSSLDRWTAPPGRPAIARSRS
jgi:hypothetical protein